MGLNKPNTEEEGKWGGGDGSACNDETCRIFSFMYIVLLQVCPERIDLIHKNYRKLCNLLVDVDEWGQVIIINMLTRYARTQFTNPNADVSREYSCEMLLPSFQRQYYENPGPVACVSQLQIIP